MIKIKLPAGLQPLRKSYGSGMKIYRSIIFWGLIACGFPAMGMGCSNPDNDVRIQALVSTELLHTHISNVTYRQIKSGISRYMLMTNNGHDHTYDLKAEDLALLELGLPLTVQSTENEYHSHTVTLLKQEFQD